MHKRDNGQKPYQNIKNTYLWIIKLWETFPPQLLNSEHVLLSKSGKPLKIFQTMKTYLETFQPYTRILNHSCL